MLKIFQTLDKIYTTNGDLVLNPTKAVVHKEDNGAFYLNLETPLNEIKVNNREKEEGLIVEGTSFQIDANITKEYSFDDFKGNTTQNGTPTPTTPIAINTVTGNQEIVVCGKNLLNFEYETSTLNGITSILDGNNLKLTGTATLNTRNIKLGMQPFKAGIYTFSLDEETPIRLIFRTMIGSTTKNSFSINVGGKSVQVTFDGTETSWRLIANPITNTTYNVDINLQLEKGSQATTYEAYNGTTYEINLGNIELCKIGTYQDRIYKNNDKWYIEKKIGKIESYNGETITTDYISTTGQLTTGATVYYVLATPTTAEITDTTLINQLESIELMNGLNNIYSSGNLPAIMKLHYNYVDDNSKTIKYIDYLTSGNIVVANTPQGEQAFRISNIEKARSKIKIKANHVFYDSLNLLIEDSYVVDKDCNDALDHLNSATSDTSPFTTISNVTNIASFRCVRKSLYEAIQVILERWGGHLVRNNWTIGIYNSIGQDNGVTIRYAKNLKNITAKYDWDDVVTKLMPVGKDGILLNAIDPNVSVYVESLNPYEIPFTKTISFNQDNIEEDNYRDEETGQVDEQAYKQALVEDLYAQATHYVEEHQIPSVNYNLSANVEKVSDIGDTIQVIDERLGISLLTHIISYDYDCILEQYTQLQFGNFTPQLTDLVSNIEKKTDEIIKESTATIQVTLKNELEQATSQIWGALSDSYVIYEGDKILIVDTLPKENATNVIMINNGGIGFSQNGINGTFQSAWTIDNVLNMEQINVINLTADLIKGGTLKLGSNLNQNGQIEVYDESNSLIAELNKNGLKMYGVDGSYVLMNNTVGFAGYDRNDNKIYWVAQDEFHMKKSVVEEEITLCNKLRFIPIEIYNGSTLVNDGIGLVSVAGGGN